MMKANDSNFAIESREQLRENLSLLVRSQLVSFLGFDDIDEIGPEDAFSDLGTDSRQAVEFKIVLESLLNCKLRTTVLFEYPSINLLVDYLLDEVQVDFDQDPNRDAYESREAKDASSIDVPTSPGSRFPLSETQRGLWYISETLNLASTFHVPLLFRLKERIDPKRFDAALQRVAHRHPILRTRFLIDDQLGQLQQEVVDAANIPPIARLETDIAQTVTGALLAIVRRPFDLSAEPPLRSRYGIDDQGNPFAILVFHHIVMDGLSAVPFVEELWRTYFDLPLSSSRGEQSSDKDFDLGFFQYLEWEANYLNSSSADSDFNFWKERLRGIDGELSLVRTGAPDQVGVGSHKQLISRELFARLSNFAERMQTPVSAVLLAVYFVLLAKIGGRDDLAITSPVSGRPGGQRGTYRDCFGSFINLIVTRCKLNPNDSFEYLLRNVRASFLDGIEHGQLPFARQLIAADKRLASGKNGPFPISFTYQNIFEAWGKNPEWQRYVELDYSIYQEIDDLLTLEVYDFQSSLQINWKYQRKEFAPASIEAWSDAFQCLLEQILNNPRNSCSKLDLCSDTQRQKVEQLFDYRDRLSTRFDATIQNVIEQIDHVASKTPDAIALISGDVRWTYQQLIEASQQHTNALTSDHKGAGALTRIDADRSPETIAKILGVLRTGAAYLPIDPKGPALRTKQIIEDAGEQVEAGTAYVLYTSGTTGIPKGVPISHTALLNLCKSMIDRYELTDADRVLQFASLTFDMSIEEIFPILCVGGTLVLRHEEDLDPHRFAALIENNAITVANLPPSYHQALSVLGTTQRTQLYRSLRVIAFGGDSLSKQTLSEVQASGIRIFNAYGPTETTVNATVAELTNSNSVHIGSPLPGVAVQVVDDAFNSLPLYVPGELCIAGCGVSNGYIGHAKGSNCFVASPNDKRSWLYRTGDQAYLDADGNVYLMGRVDDQINLRGHRIEPGEIEAAITSLAEVREAAVVMLQDRIVAFYTAGEPIEDRTLRGAVQDRIPAIMVPSIWLAVESLPLNDRGKVDRKRLATLAESRLQEAFLSTANATDAHDTCPVDPECSSDSTWAVLGATLSELLKTPDVRLDDNFFELGGHSLLAIQVVARINRDFKIQIQLRQFLEVPSFRELCLKIGELLSISSMAKQIVAPHDNAGLKQGILSPSQARLWFLDRLGESTAYKIPAMAEVFGPIDVNRVRFAAEKIAQRHASLRTRFVNREGKPFQLVLEEATIPFAEGTFATDIEALEWVHAEASKPFDLEHGPLLRIAMAKIENASEDSPSAILLVCMHHIISDGWSMQVWINEFKHFYEHAKFDVSGDFVCPHLPSLPLQYVDYSERLAKMPVNAKGLQFWKQQLEGYEEIDLLTDYPRPEILSNRGGVVLREVPASLNQAIKLFCRQTHVTPSPFWLAAIFGMLRKRGCGSDLCFGVPVAGRSDADLESLIGFFVNTIVVRIQQQSNSVNDFVKYVADAVADGLEHQDVPIEDVFSQLAIERQTDRSPVFQVLFSYAAIPVEPIRLATESEYSCILKPIPPKNETSKFELTFSIQERSDGSATLAIEYASSLFRESTIIAMLEQMLNVATQMVEAASADVAIEFASCVLEPQAFAIQSDTNANATSSSTQSMIPMRFVDSLEATTRRYPEQTAIEDEQAAEGLRIVSYADLYQRIRSSGSRCAQHSLEVLEPIRGASLILKCVESLVAEKPFTFHDEYASVALPEETAYVLSTSGSSGKSKGVAISRFAMDNHNAAFVDQFGVGPADRIAQYAAPTFDLFIEEVFPAFRSGATVVVVPDAIRLDFKQFVRWIIARRITIVDLPTAVFHAMIAEGTLLRSELPNVRLVIVGGESLSRVDADSFLTSHSDIELWNTYGPTEATVICSVHHVVHKDLVSDPPIGRSFANNELLVVDPDGYLVPDSVPGELVITGPSLALGYVIESQLISKTLGFRNHPLDKDRTAYWTGDRVRRDTSGRLWFLGRMDDQVKIRGSRVEPNEVAQRLRQHPSVRTAAVVSNLEKNNTSDSLAGLIAAIDCTAPLESIRDELVSLLPVSMQPNQWIQVSSIPMTPRGKVDRRQILQLARAARNNQSTRNPSSDRETESQRKMRSIWNRLLGHGQFSLDDDFFHVGGHSLLAAQWIYEIEANFDHVIAVLDAFRFPTIRRMLSHLESLRSSGTDIDAKLAFNSEIKQSFDASISLTSLFRSRRSESTNWAVVLPGLPGLGELYRPLAEILAEDRNVLVMTMPGYGGEASKNSVPSNSIQQLAARWFDVITTIINGEPVEWIAHSYSGTILFELLRAFGKRLPNPKHVTLLDCWPHALRVQRSPGERIEERLRSFALDSIPRAEKVVRAALAAAPIVPSEPLDIPITLAIAQTSREWLGPSNWTPYFRRVGPHVIQGDHFSIARPPDCHAWLNQTHPVDSTQRFNPTGNPLTRI